MNIVLTGSLGHISKPLAEELIENGHSVTVISSNAGKQKDIEALGAKTAIGSIDNANFLTTTFKGADIIYLMEPPFNFFDQNLDIEAFYTNIVLTYVKAVQQSEVKKIIHLSSIGAHTDKGNGMLYVHHYIENILKELPDDVSIKRLFTPILFCFILVGLFSCSSTKNIAGKYGTNFVDMGFFGTTIKLKQDSTLEYTFGGDMIHHHVTGHYKIYDHKVYMLFDKEKLDSNFAAGPLFADTGYKTIFKGDTILYQSFCYIGHDKLFFAHVLTGKKISKARRYNKRKKYLLFGSHYYKRRWYLQRIN